tara:strand:- start:202 stop:405 length:204 start_codon:yes stop_codon:yes gene_type:complete
MQRTFLIIVIFLNPEISLAFCGNFEFGVATGFGAQDWLSKIPLLLVILTVCLSPLYFFLKRFGRAEI